MALKTRDGHGDRQGCDGFAGGATDSGTEDRDAFFGSAHIDSESGRANRREIGPEPFEFSGRHASVTPSGFRSARFIVPEIEMLQSIRGQFCQQNSAGGGQLGIEDLPAAVADPQELRRQLRP